MTRHNCTILLDVGGTAVKSALGTRTGGPLPGTFALSPMPSGGKAEEIGAAFRTAVDLQLQRAAEAGMLVAGLAAALPGPFDYSGGIFRMKHKFAAVEGCALRDLLGLDAAMPMALVHDVVGALMGNLSIEGDGGNMALITLGTGLGFAAAAGGTIRTAASGSPADSIWNLPYRGGILEDYVSRRGIIRNFTELGGAEDLDVKEIADLAHAGDRVAREAFLRSARILCEAVSPLVKDLHIGKVVFGGRISLSLDLMMPVLGDGLGAGVVAKASEDIEGAVLKGLSTLI